MGRVNGRFEYKPLQELTRDPKTGFPVSGSSGEWLDGIECQIDKGFPAIVKRGTDGQEIGYNFDVFVSKYCKVEFAVGMVIRVTDENGGTDEFTIQGVDSLNRRYTEIWG